MDWAACVLRRHGEDAHFGHAGAGFVGVADGVGGYRKYGVDAGAFARELMTTALARVEQSAKSRRLRLRLGPKDVLERAYETAFLNGTPGASTAVVLSLDRANLRWAYIGDSAFAVLRGGKIVHRSVQQQLYFNCPYQLNAYGHGGIGGSLTKAKVGEMPVEDGDVVVVGTDGLFDNMRDGQLERAVSKGTELGFSPKNMADIVAGIAYKVSMDKRAHSPYSREYYKEYGRICGGKKDDITVIVAYIVRKDS
jgi:protein phosphatase PTC7